MLTLLSMRLQFVIGIKAPFIRVGFVGILQCDAVSAGGFVVSSKRLLRGRSFWLRARMHGERGASGIMHPTGSFSATKCREQGSARSGVTGLHHTIGTSCLLC